MTALLTCISKEIGSNFDKMDKVSYSLTQSLGVNAAELP
jgi:hypothetical protein